MASRKSDKSEQARLEEAILKFWDKNRVFAKSLEKNKNKKEFVFFDGPPYANGLPHHGHAVQSIIKDSVTRYKTMRGYYVPRRTGWDTHGLPIEYKIEQELGFSGKEDIEKYGIARFNKKCRDSVFKYVKEWNDFFDRIGRWRDTTNQYATLDNSYIESVWWVFAQIYKQGNVYEDFRSTPYCPRCATPLSNFEVNLGYKDNVKDPSLFVKFKLKDDNRYLVAWTTTPWSLPGNAALAVHPSELYTTVKVTNDEGKEEYLVIAEKLLAILNQEYEVVSQESGLELVGKDYESLFKLNGQLYPEIRSDNLFKVWAADFVSIEDGSGILHVAPAFGEEDLALAKEHAIPVLSTVDKNGRIKPGIGVKRIEGKFFKSADKMIIEYLAKAKAVFAVETIEHTYPFCWRCDSPLLYYATTSWFINVSNFRDKLLKNNRKINWIPEHIKNGRFGKWLAVAKDWAFSRNRYWGAPLPLWKTEDGEVIVVESVEELKRLADEPDKIRDLHRPFIDDVVITTESGKKAYRVEEVFDVWFESGSMPYAQDHYPFENKHKVETHFPADFIAEAMDQTRGWFYSLHVIATYIFNQPAYKNVITTGWVNAADGQKLSKRLKNYTPLDELFNLHGADPVRLFMLTSPIVHGEDIRFSSDYLRDVKRGLFMTLSNVVNFFKLYGDVDGWKLNGKLIRPVSDNLLDKWILARLDALVEEVTTAADSYYLDKATRPLVEFINDLSNWYIRLNRRRFWKSENDTDKDKAYATLHYVIQTFLKLIAPWIPFTAEGHYQEMRKYYISSKLSVHLEDWPSAPKKIDRKLLGIMKQARDIVTDALAQRAKSGIKLRQPIALINVVTKTALPTNIQEIIKQEVNAKKIEYSVGAEERVEIDDNITTELYMEGLAKDLIRRIQNFRKQLGLNVDDRIVIKVKAEGELAKAYTLFKALVLAETLAKESSSNDLKHKMSVQIRDDRAEVWLDIDE